MNSVNAEGGTVVFYGVVFRIMKLHEQRQGNSPMRDRLTYIPEAMPSILSRLDLASDVRILMLHRRKPASRIRIGAVR